MDKLHLVVLDFENYRKGFPLWSVIYVKIDDKCFPDDQWWDATSSILEMWANNLASFLCECEDSCTLDFMDGDYTIRIERTASKHIKATFKKTSSIVLCCDSIDLVYFIRQILSAAERLKNSTTEIKNSRMIERLSYEVDKLRMMLRQHNTKH